MEQEKIEFEDIPNNFAKEIIIRYFNTLLKGYFMQIENYQKQNFYRFELTEIIDNRNNFNEEQRSMIFSRNMYDSGFWEPIVYTENLNERDFKRIRMENILKDVKYHV